VLVDRGHCQRVKRLQKQCADAADEHRCVAVDHLDRIGMGEPADALFVMDAVAALWPFVSGDAGENHRSESITD